jgi:hypothetical protein
MLRIPTLRWWGLENRGGGGGVVARDVWRWEHAMRVLLLDFVGSGKAEGAGRGTGATTLVPKTISLG